MEFDDLREKQEMKRNEREREQMEVDGSLSFYLYRNNEGEVGNT